MPEIESEFTVSGILEATGSQDDGFFYLPLATAQRKFNQVGKITAVQVRLTDPSLAPGVAEELEAMLPNAEIIRMEELLGSMTALMDSARALIFAIVAVAITISALGVLNTMLMSVFERTKEIGVLRATGAGRLHIFSLIWTETLGLTLVGGAAGLVLAVVSARAVVAVLRHVLPYAPSDFALGFSANTLWFCLGVSVVLGLVAGSYPAWRAASISPIEAIRGGGT